MSNATISALFKRSEIKLYYNNFRAITYELAMNTPITGEIMVEMLNQLVVKHYYATKIVPLISELTSFIALNEQLRQTLEEIADKNNFRTKHQINWSELNSAQRKVINCFFDYLYFTSPQFLKDID